VGNVIIAGLNTINKQIIKILGETGIDSTKTDDATGNLMELKDDRKEYDDSVKKISELKKLQKKSELKLTAKEKEKTDVGNVIDGIKNKITEFEESINSLPDYEAELKIVESKERKIDSDLLDIANNLGRIQIVNKQKEITDTKLEIKESEKWNKKHKKLGDYYTWIKEFFIPTVAEIEKQVLISIQQNFNETYRKWFRVLIDDPSKESRIDEHFTPIVEQDGYEQNVYYLSGGEITSVSLAYRLTLNMTMRQETESMNSNLLILDEPTDGFSKNQLSKVKDVLREMNSEQIILVSHEAELETYVDNVFQISKSEGYSRVTRMN
jgi:exonuclease SbcC